MKKIVIFILLGVLVFAGCSNKIDSNSLEVPDPTAIPTATPTPEPTPEPTIQPTAAPTPKVEFFEYLVDFEMQIPTETVFLGEWTFKGEKAPITMNDITYEKGIGMYVASSSITSETASISTVWDFEKRFHKLAFDLGCEQSNQFGNEELYGKYKVDIIVNGEEVWTSEYQDYTYTADVEIVLNEECEWLEIRLTQYKGSRGTLNVVFGDFKLYSYAE